MFFKKIWNRINEVEIELKKRIYNLEQKPDVDIKTHLKNLETELKHLFEIKCFNLESFFKNLATDIYKELEKEISDLKQHVAINALMVRDITRLDDSLTDVEKKISQISDQYYQTVEKILNFNKEIFIKDIFLHNVKDKEFENFRTELLQPLLEAKWAKDKEDKGQKILNKGVKVIERREALYQEMLVKERQNQDVTELKKEIKVYDDIIREALNDTKNDTN